MGKRKIPVVSIESGHPVPDTLMSYPFGQMNVGDSFLIPISKRSTVASAATKFGERNNMKFLVRKIDKENLRVWRSE